MTPTRSKPQTIREHLMEMRREDEAIESLGTHEDVLDACLHFRDRAMDHVFFMLELLDAADVRGVLSHPFSERHRLIRDPLVPDPVPSGDADA